MCCYIRCWRFSFGVGGEEGDAVLGDRAEQSVIVRRRSWAVIAELLFFSFFLWVFYWVLSCFLGVVLFLLFLLFL